MKRVDCQCCGAALPIPERFQRYIKCSYCNATYEVEGYEKSPQLGYDMQYVNYILIEPGYIKKYGAKVTLTEEQAIYYPPEILERFIKENLAQQIADILMKELPIHEDYNLYDMTRVYSTNIRIDVRK